MTEQQYLRVSYSSLNTFHSCARKFEFAKLYPRKRVDFESFAADVGTALHHGYQEFLMTRDEEKAIWALMKSYPYALEWAQEKNDRSILASIVTLEEMIHHHPMNEWRVAEIKKPNGDVVPAIEVPFELRIKGITLPDGRGIAFTGFVDAFMRHVMSDRFGAFDIKTHRRYAKDATAKYQFDMQQVPYGIGLEHIQGKKVDSFEVQYLDTFVDLENPRVEVYGFTKTATDIEEWLTNTVLAAQQIQRYMEMDYFPRVANGCESWNRPCYYLNVCHLRDRKTLTTWFLEGEEAAVESMPEPWIVAEIDPFGNIGEES